MKGARPLRTTRRMSNWGQRPAWYNLKEAPEAGKPLLVHIYDEIGFWGVSAKDFVDDLTAHEGDLEMHINSPGGDIFDGIAIYNTMKQRSGLVKVVIDGLAASAASFIAQAATENELYIAPHGQMMIHDGFAMAIGNAADMRETAELLDKASDNIAAIYATRTGRDAAYWRERMRAETWYSDQEAVDAGLADSIYGAEGAAKASWNLSVFNRAGILGAASHAPYTGKHTHDHNAYGQDGADTDGMHGHEHEHNGDSSHDHHAASQGDSDEDDNPANTLRPLILNDAVDESSWDRSRAMHEAGQKDNPAKAFAEICAGRRDGPADEAQNWALPHHYPGKPCNAAGVRSALGYLSSTKGLTNTDAAKAHLHSHMKVINPDWEPGDEFDIALLMHSVQEAIQ